MAETLARLESGRQVASPLAGRWLSEPRWKRALEAIAAEVLEYARRYPARFGVPKGDLKSGLKRALEPALFDAAFDALVEGGALAMRSERVRPADVPWEAPAATMAALERQEAEFEASGFAVAENAQWQAKLGAQAGEVMALGLFLERLVRVSQDLTYTAHQLAELRVRLERHFAKQPTLGVADFKDLAGVSRKYAVPLLEHADRSGWTVRSGDERKPGGRLG